jgi:hypothetical protein
MNFSEYPRGLIAMNGNGRGAYSKRSRSNNRSERQNKNPVRGETGEHFSPRDSGAPQRGNKNRNGRDRQKTSSGFNEMNRPPYQGPKGVRGRDRPKWTPPALSKEPIPAPLCPLCGKPIEELASAINDKISGEAAHFDCVRGKIAALESLGKNDELSYIGGGRFGVISFDSQDKRYFKIKKIIEYEAKDLRAKWRGNIADHFSLT